MATPTLAAAQPSNGPATSPAQSAGFLEAIGQWFAEQAGSFNSSIHQAREHVEQFSREAEAAARVTAGGAREAADAVGRIPRPQIVMGHGRCGTASNGAPDCISAADAMCKAKGFSAGRSIDMTTAEICEPRVWLAGRNSGPGCHTETFVSRVICH